MYNLIIVSEIPNFNSETKKPAKNNFNMNDSYLDIKIA